MTVHLLYQVITNKTTLLILQTIYIQLQIHLHIRVIQSTDILVRKEDAK